MIYLDNAATSFPKPREVADAVAGTITRMGANPGRSGHKLSLGAARVVIAAREQLAELFGVDDPFRFVFALNCTDALNLAIKGCLYPGDHVVTTALEHNSVLRPLKSMERRGMIRLTILRPGLDGVVPLKEYEENVRAGTRLVVSTHASNLTGAIQPVEGIGRVCRKVGSLFLVDAAQSAGILPIDAAAVGADMLAFPGHKGLYGPTGTGALYIRPGLFLNTLREGGTGSSSDSWFQPSEMPERYESGTVNTCGLAGLFVGARFVRRHFDEIEARERALSDVLYRGIASIPGVRMISPPKNRVGVVAFNIRGEQSGHVADRLDDADFAVRAGLHCAPAAHRFYGTLEQGAVRASVGFYNTMEHVERFCDEVARISRDQEGAAVR